jgi:hypothetical protein
MLVKIINPTITGWKIVVMVITDKGVLVGHSTSWAAKRWLKLADGNSDKSEKRITITTNAEYSGSSNAEAN